MAGSFGSIFSAAKSFFSLGSVDIAPPVAFLLKQVIEEGMTDMFTCDTRAFRIWVFQRNLSEKPLSGLSPREGSPLSSDHPPLASRSRGLAVTQDGGALSALNDEIPVTL